MLSETYVVTEVNTDSRIINSNTDIIEYFTELITSPGTQIAYKHDWKMFEEWCSEKKLVFFPTNNKTVALFISDQANKGFKIATIERRLAAIRFAHKAKGLTISPNKDNTISKVLSEARCKLDVVSNKKVPLEGELFKQLLSYVPQNTIKGIRDRALLLVGFGGALRRTELVSLCVENIKTVEEGLKVIIRNPTVNQGRTEQEIAIPRESTELSICPVTALEKWLKVSQINEGPIFYAINRGGNLMKPLTGQSIRLIIRHYAKTAGINANDFSANSLRSGWITSAAKSGASIFKIQEVSRHKYLSYLSGYMKNPNKNKFKDHAGAGLLTTKVKGYSR